MKTLKEWFIKAPWGKIALASWGNPHGDPVLLVHGRQDSLDTFLPLLKYLPDKYYYVGFDLPGNGKSDDFSTGITVTRLLPLSAIDAVIQHLKWSSFIYIGHSMGAELGLFYNAIYPGKITKLILLDVKPGIQRLQINDIPTFFKDFYSEYYCHYKKYNVDDRRYTKEQALNAVMKARGMTREEAEVILTRNLKKIGENQYMLSWDKRQKILAPSHQLPQFYSELFSKHAPPSLYINAKSSNSNAIYYMEGKDAVDKILDHMQRNVPNLFMVDVDGAHDVHFTNPERVEKQICTFLKRNFIRNTESKL